jgi:hypothetical protein
MKFHPLLLCPSESKRVFAGERTLPPRRDRKPYFICQLRRTAPLCPATLGLAHTRGRGGMLLLRLPTLSNLPPMIARCPFCLAEYSGESGIASLQRRPTDNKLTFYDSDETVSRPSPRLVKSSKVG